MAEPRTPRAETGALDHSDADAARPVVSLIAALDRHRVIGVDNRLPWRLPADLGRFRRLTIGHPVVMGRKTLESLGRPLPQRTNIVVTRQAGFTAPGCTVAGSMEEALHVAAQAPGGETIYVIGGAQVYAAALGQASRLDLTEVDTAVAGGDAYFPEINARDWLPVSRESHPADAQNPLPFAHVTYLRR
jgi:dihydrofolate reductase